MGRFHPGSPGTFSVRYCLLALLVPALVTGCPKQEQQPVVERDIFGAPVVEQPQPATGLAEPPVYVPAPRIEELEEAGPWVPPEIMAGGG